MWGIIRTFNHQYHEHTEQVVRRQLGKDKINKLA